MSRWRRPAVVAITSLIAHGVAPIGEAVGRDVRDLSLDWRYHRGPVAGEAWSATYDDRSWERVVVPHTYRLASINLDDSEDDASQPTFHRDVCWYRRRLPTVDVDGRRVYLEFEAAHQVAELWVNGRYIGRHDTGGFTPFHFDITEALSRGSPATVAVRLDNRANEGVPPDGSTRDYVLFGGLYRDVRLVVTDSLHVTFPWESRQAGVRVTTPSVSRSNATITVETGLRNDGALPASCRVVTLIADAEGVIIERLSTIATVKPNETRTVVQTGGIHEDVRLWSPDVPHLYRVHTLVVDKGRIIDHVTNPLGLRWFDLVPGVGFLINGEPTELIGANRHQQYPYIGDAVPNNLHRGDAIRFKRAGLNVVRLAHYPHDNAFLQACDELGLLVFEEPPTWIHFGPPEWWDRLERAQRVMIRNHRNHPCVVGWAGGVNHRGPVRRLHYAAKQEDPTRITVSNSTLWTGPPNSGIADLYSVMDYRGATVPEGGLLFGMEHSGSLDVSKHQELVSRYRADPNRVGLTLWSAHDGFSFKKRGVRYPNLSVWKASLWDPFRIPKPAYHWYRSELTSQPMVWIPDDRAQQPESVTVFSNCDSVELRYSDGTTLHRLPRRDESTAALKASPVLFPRRDDRGPITAVGYVNGSPVAKHSVRPATEPHHLEVELNTDGFRGVADGASILIAYARVCDAEGETVVDSTTPVAFKVDGPGAIVGDASIGANPIVWERGVAPVLVRVGRESGELTLTAAAEGLEPGTATLVLRRRSDDRMHTPLPTERRRFRVDLGGDAQHVEEDWTAWHGSNDHASIVLEDSIGPPVTVDLAGKEPLSWSTSWGVPGDLCYMIEDGATARRELRLTFRGLTGGSYRLRMWHHRIVDSQDQAPALSLELTDADGPGRLAVKHFVPSFGRKIHVSADGGGSAGDGGSGLAASRYAETYFRADSGGEVVVQVESLGGGPVTLSGLELLSEPQAYTPRD